MRTMDIERALKWAYCEELPKAAADRGGVAGPRAAAPAWTRVSEAGRLGTVIDENRYGVVPFGDVDERPHDDAVTIAEAVDRLGGLTVEAIEMGDLVGDLAGIDPRVEAAAREAVERVSAVGADGVRRLLLDLPTLMRRHAKLGGEPAGTTGETPKVVDVVGSNGRPVWRKRVLRPVRWDAAGDVTAWSEGEIDVAVVNGRPPMDAYRVQTLRPDPLPMYVARLTWSAWVAGLLHLTEALDGALAETRVVWSGRAARPWLGEADVARGRVLVAVARAARRRAASGEEVVGGDFGVDRRESLASRARGA